MKSQNDYNTKKDEYGHYGRPTCERTSLEPRVRISFTLEDHDEGSGVHRLAMATR